MADLVLTRRDAGVADAGRADERVTDDRGAVAVLVAVLMTVLLGLCAVVVDLGLARALQRDAQTASDSAALAAGSTMQGLVFPASGTPKTTAEAEPYAVAAAKTYARLNLGITDDDWKNCSDPQALTDTPDTALYNNTCISFGGGLVRVVLPRRSSPAIFAGVFGAQQFGYGSVSTSQWETIPSATCWLCVQSRSSSVGLDIGDGFLWESSGDVRVGVTATTATLSAGTGWMWASGRILYTGAAPTHVWQFFPTPQQTTTSWAPAASSFTVTGNVSPSPTGPECQPGIYDSVARCVQFLPGTYVLTGSTVFTGNASVSGPGVSFYLTCSRENHVVACSTTEHKSGGSLTWSANASLNLWGPATGSAYPATITVDPANTAAQVLVNAPANVTSRAYVTGGIWAPGSLLTVQSAPGAPWWSAVLDVDGPITVDRLTLSGPGPFLYHHGTPPTSGSPTKVRLHLVD